MPSGIYKRKPLTETHKRNIGIGGTGLKRSGIALLNISNTNKKPWREERRQKMIESKIGNKNPMFGKHPSIETSQKKRESMLRHPNRKFKETGIELKIEEELKNRGINHKKQVPLCKVAVVDFYLPDFGIIIQCDGCYWHNCPECKKGDLNRNKDKDVDQDAVLTSNGYKVYRFWEHSINKSPKKCIDKLGLC